MTESDLSKLQLFLDLLEKTSPEEYATLFRLINTVIQASPERVELSGDQKQRLADLLSDIRNIFARISQPAITTSRSDKRDGVN